MQRIAPPLEPRRTGRQLRLGFLVDLAPRKLGSFEDLSLAICSDARTRGHVVDIFCRAPVHPLFAQGVAGLGGRIGSLDALMGDPAGAVRRLRQLDVIQLHHCGARDRIALLAYAAVPARVLFVDRGSGDPSDERRSPVRRLISTMLDRVTALRLSGVRGVSNWVQARDASRFGAKLCGTIHNGVDLVRFHPGLRPAGADRPARVIVVSQLVPQKGLHVLLAALSSLRRPDVQVEIVGDGPLHDELRALAGQLGVAGQVTFAGLCSDVPERLRNADLLVHPAVWGEAFGYAIAEAQASGLPVLATAVGGIPEVVAHGETGVLVPPGDATALARALGKLLDDTGLRARMGAAARRRAEERFDLERCAALYVDWAESVA